MLRFLLKRKGIILLAVLFLVSATLLARYSEKREGGGLFDAVIIPVLSPLLKVSTAAFTSVNHMWQAYFNLVGVRGENALLQKAVAELQRENQLLQEAALENRRLRELLGFKKKVPYHFVPAEIIGRDPSSWFRTLLIDKGTDSGIRRGAAVMTAQGMVGKILEVENKTAKVLLLIDSNSALDILVQRSRAKGIIEGRTEELCELRFVSKNEDIRSGDVIITSGLDEIIPKGIVVGAVVNVVRNSPGFFQLVEVKPAADFSRLEEVLVVVQ
jgi:rod shape-determining protein MreC